MSQGHGHCCCCPYATAATINLDLLSASIPNWARFIRFRLFADDEFTAASFVDAGDNTQTYEFVVDYYSEDADYYYFRRSTGHGRTLFVEMVVTKAVDGGGTSWIESIEIRDDTYALKVLRIPTPITLPFGNYWVTAGVANRTSVGCVGSGTATFMTAVRRIWEDDLATVAPTMSVLYDGVTYSSTPPLSYSLVYDGFSYNTQWYEAVAGYPLTGGYYFSIAANGTQAGGISGGHYLSAKWVKVFGLSSGANVHKYTPTTSATSSRDLEAVFTDYASLIHAPGSPWTDEPKPDPTLTGFTC